MELFAHEAGAGDETIVLLHGFGGTHRAWHAVLPPLAASHRVLAYDLPGHGASLDWPQAGPAKVAARAVLGDLARRGISRAHLAGHSMGGAVAVLAGLFEPARVASLSLLAPGGFGPEINHRLLMRFAAARDARSLRSCLEAMVGWYSPVPEDAVAAALEMRADARQTAMLLQIGAQLALNGRQGEIPRSALATLAMRVQLVWGRIDNVLPVFQGENLPASFAMHVLPDTGHMLPHEAPQFVVERILAFASSGS